MNPEQNKQTNKTKNQAKKLTQPRYIIVKSMEVKNEKYSSFITCLQILWYPSLQEVIPNFSPLERKLDLVPPF